jgi:HlyD family secretion protein
MKRILLVLLLLATAGVAAWLLSHRPAATPLVSGTIEVDTAHVASRYGGRVVKLHAQEGDTLKPGQIIAELDAAELRARRDYIAAVLAELEAGPRTNEIAAAQHEWESLTAQLPAVQADARRARQLFAEKTISESEMQNAASRADALSQNAIAAKKRYDLLLEGTRPERLAQARAQLAEIETQLREMQIVAPSDCVLEILNVKVGDVLPPNREVATLLLTGHLWVRVYVPEPWLAGIQIGQKVVVHADGSSREFEGVVEQINRQAEFTPRNVQTVEDRVRQVFGVKIRLPSDTILKAGMSVDVRFPSQP